MALLAACASPAVDRPGSPATTAEPATTTSTSATSTHSGPPESLAVSTPVAPAAPVDGSTSTAPTAAPAQQGQDAGTQRHPFAPESITLDVRGVKAVTASIQVIDTGPTGELSLPADPGQVGWWQSGALAGDAYGTVVLAGHIDSRDHGIGFFIRLLKVEPGDEVVLGDGSYLQRYRVTSNRDVPKASLATGTDTFSHSVPGRLVLLTCTGTYTPATHYPDNLVVTADPVGVPTPQG